MAIVKVFYRSPHNYDVDLASDEASVKDFGPSMTVQSMAEDLDLNIVMKRFGVTGKLPENPRIPSYGDFSDVFDFRTAQEAVIAAQRGFDDLPHELRSRFGNDPQALLEFVSNDANRPEAERLGLVKAKPQEATEPAAKPPATPGAT